MWRWIWRRTPRCRCRSPGLVDQLMKAINQDKMKALLSMQPGALAQAARDAVTMMERQRVEKR